VPLSYRLNGSVNQPALTRRVWITVRDAIKSLKLDNVTADLDLSLIDNLHGFKSLEIINCPQVYNLKISPHCDLHTLEISNSERLASRIDLSQHSLFGSLVMTGGFADANIRQLKTIAEMGDGDGFRNQIWEIVIADCRSPLLANIDFFSGFSRLNRLEVVNCDALRTIRSSERFKELRRIRVIDCDSLSELSNCKTMPKLESFAIDFCDQLSDISEVAEMSPLRHFSFEKNLAITDISPLLKLPLHKSAHLRLIFDLDSQISEWLDRPEAAEISELYLGGISSGATLRKIRLTESLKNLTLVDSESIRDLKFLLDDRQTNYLDSLTLIGCPNLRDISQLKQLRVRKLEILDCPLISESQIAEVLEK